MTREEAIKVLLSKPAIAPSNSERQKKLNEAIDLAIESLSAEPSGDLISRDDAIDTIEYWHGIDVSEAINKIPSADRPKGEWIDREDSKPEPYIPETSTERVVHCKDCIYSSQPDGEKLFVCGNVLGMSGWVGEDEFCSSGSL